MQNLVASLLVILLLPGCQPKMPAYDWNLPEGFPKPTVPADNPMSDAKVELGRHLFYDNRLSANQTQSCASCHQQHKAFAEELTVSVGSTGQLHRRNSLALVNIAYNSTLTWAHSGLQQIEQQLLLPMFGETPVELGITGAEQQVLARFSTGKYPALFESAFPGQALNFDLIVKALSSFVRSLISLNSAFDRYAYFADDLALNASAKRGLNLFFSERLECHHCHGGFNFTQSSKHQNQPLDLKPFHNTGLYNINHSGDYPMSDQGLVEVSFKRKDMGRFRAPTLRNVAVTAPYMHDGSVASLQQVIEFYAAGGRGAGINNPFKSPFVKGFELSEQDKQDLLAFLHSLTDIKFLSNPKFSEPK